MKINSQSCAGLLAVVAGFYLQSASAQVVVTADSFSDGFDEGTDSPYWTRYPGQNIGLGNTWSFPTIANSYPTDLGYQMTSGIGSQSNPGRVGSIYRGLNDGPSGSFISK